MNIKQLKQLLEGLDDDMVVLIPTSHEFDGIFYTPCSQDSGVSQMGTAINLEEEDIKEMELLNKEIPSEDTFLLIPCGFFDMDNQFDDNHLLN